MDKTPISSDQGTPESRQEKKNLMKMKVDRELQRENRILMGAFICGLLATLFFLVSFSSEFWVHVTLNSPEKKYDKDRGHFNKTGHYHGLWRFCRNELWPNKDNPNVMEPYIFCRRMTFDVLPNVEKGRIEVETKMADFRRSTVAVGIIALVLSVLAHCFTWYSINQFRYMYKRLAGCLHLITGASCWVVSEVFRQSMMFEEKAMKSFVKQFQEIAYGWSYYMVWVSFFLFLVPGVILLVYSRKRKGRKARSMKEACENEPVHLGRI